MNIDIVETLENCLKINKKYIDNLYEKFFDIVVNKSIDMYRLKNPLLTKYFKLPNNNKYITEMINYEDDWYSFIFYMVNDKIELFNYFKDNIEIKEINYFIKNYPNFVKMLIMCKKNEWIIKAINDGIIKIDKNFLMCTITYLNIELFKTLIQMDKNCVNIDLVKFLIKSSDYEIKWEMFEFMVELFGDKLPVDNLILEEALRYDNIKVYNLLIEKVKKGNV